MPTDLDKYLFGMGYDRAKKLGLLFHYKKMLNRGGSANYSAADLEDAKKSDAKNPDSLANLAYAKQKAKEYAD